MNNFIKLHEFPDNKPIVINSDVIAACQRENYDNGTGTRILFSDFDSIVIVFETPDRIYEMIMNKNV